MARIPVEERNISGGAMKAPKEVRAMRLIKKLRKQNVLLKFQARMGKETIMVMQREALGLNDMAERMTGMMQR